MKFKLKLNKILWLIFIVYIISANFGCITETKGQLVNTQANSSSLEKKSDEAEIEVFNESFVVVNTNLDTVLQSNLPTIKFNFTCKSENKDCMSNESLNKLLANEKDIDVFEKYWKEALSFRYETIFQKSKLDANAYYEKTVQFVNKYDEFKKLFQNTYINAPNGKRTISDQEASSIIKGINLASSEVIKRLG